MSMYILVDCMAKTHQLDKNDKKERKLRSFGVNNVALSNFYAPWSVLKEQTGGNVIDSEFAYLIIDWNQYQQFLLQRVNDKTAGERLRYAKQFLGVPQTVFARHYFTPDNTLRTRVLRAVREIDIQISK